MKCDLFWCNFPGSAGSDFCAADILPGTFIDFCFMIFSKVLMKELANMLIHVHEIFSSVLLSFKILLSVYLVVVEEEL